MSVGERRLILCADDFGLSPAISRGIAGLAHEGRLSAISWITNAAHWTEAAARLRALPASVTLGLHFNLTEGQPLSAELRSLWPDLPSLPKLLVMSHLRRLPMAALRHEWHAQFARFVEATGHAPQMVDGHQHVHHLPGVREIVLEGVTAQPVRPAVRNTGRLLGPGYDFKRWVIERTGGRALQRDLRRHRLAHNATLLGAYDFLTPDYRRLMQQWLAQLPPEGGLVFCHPGEGDADPRDAIAPARERERRYLSSDAFREDLAAASVRLGDAWVQA